jgi:hypothetical protein
MRMKDVLLLCAMLSAVGCLAQEPESYTKDYKHALRYGAKAKMTLRIVDEAGVPVSNAVASVVFLPPKAISNTVVRGLSDEKGLFVAEGVSTKSIGGYVSKDGYYGTNFKCPRGNPANPYDNASKVKGDRWLPWNPTIPVVLREIRNPIPMYVKRFEGKFPDEAKVGFDCEVGDFVAPHGSGKTSDFFIHTGEMRLSAVEQGGGFLVRPSHSNSAFKSDYFAPEDGYAAELSSREVIDERNGRLKSVLYDYGDDYGFSRNHLVFKSRIKRDPDGKIVSAKYGKIYGNFEYWKESVKFLYYFNPTPNDRNLEFDGKNNLFKPGWNSNLNWSREP